MKKILVSACLMGHAVRYDGRAEPLAHPAIEQWRQEGRLVTICPEMSAGMPVPRPPAEIESGRAGEDVLSGHAGVFEITGRDVTAEFLRAAENAVALARESGCRYALLIDGSPSCGSGFVHDGSFSGGRKAGNGVTAAALRRAGVEVFAHGDIDRLVERLAPSPLTDHAQVEDGQDDGPEIVEGRKPEKAAAAEHPDGAHPDAAE